MRRSVVRLHRAKIVAASLALVAFTTAARAQDAAPLERGIQLFRERRYGEAREQLLPLAKATPASAAAAYWVGRAFYEDTAWDDAAKWLERATQLDDRVSEYHLWYGAALGARAQRASKLKQPFLAKHVKSEFDRAVALDPNNLDARDALISFYLQAPGIMGGSVAKAREQAEEIRRRDPYLGGLKAASIALHEKDTAAAAREYDSLTRAYPDSGSGYYGLVNMLWAQKRTAETWAAIDRLAQRQPDNMVALFLIGRESAATGEQLDRGEAALRRYLAHPPTRGEPSLAAAHYRLGMLQEKRGNAAAARAEYEAALRLDPKLKPAQDALKNLR